MFDARRLEADIVNAYNGQRKLRGGVQPVFASDIPRAESDPYPATRARVFAQQRAREEYELEKLTSGGDESQFMSVDIGLIDEDEAIEFSPSGVLLSAGIHRISGPPGGGKTRFAGWEILQRVRDGEVWAVFDKEMGQKRYKRMMRQLGADDDDLERIHYIDTKNEITPDLIRHGRAFMRYLERLGCNGIVYDSQTVFLGAASVSENDAQGVRNWTVAACSGIECAIILDHLGHSNDEHGRGSSDKAAGCDIDLILKVTAPFAVGLHGAISLEVKKDRSGTLPVDSEISINVICKPDDDGMTFSPAEWGIQDNKIVLSVSEQLSLILMRTGRDYAIARELREVLSGRRQHRVDQIREAVRNGEIQEEIVGNSLRYYEI